MCWEVIPFSLSYGGREVFIEDYCDFFGVSHGACCNGSGSVAGFLHRGQEVFWELVLMSSSCGNSGLYDLYWCFDDASRFV